MKIPFKRPVNAIPATAIRLLAENRRTTGAASIIVSTWLDFNSRRRNAARGASAPGQNAEVRRWRASPKRWTIPNGPGLAVAWPAHARETSSITERPTRVVCKKLRLPDVRAITQRMIPKTRLTITRSNHIRPNCVPVRTVNQSPLCKHSINVVTAMIVDRYHCFDSYLEVLAGPITPRMMVPVVSCLPLDSMASTWRTQQAESAG